MILGICYAVTLLDAALERQAAMAIVHRLGERIGNARTDADQRGLLDPSLAAIWSAVRKPMPRISRATR
jgi:hypothetical protein